MPSSPLKYSLWLALVQALVMVVGTSCSGPGSKTDRPQKLAALFDKQWAANPLWDDGLAEVATYAAKRVIYKKVRTFDCTLITVKEDFNKSYNVKTDTYTRRDLFPVMKVNLFCRIPTDNYPYHFMTSMFFRRHDPVHLHKMSSSSQEWCGQTFKAITREKAHLHYAYNSYWDNEGVGEIYLDKDLIFEDQLPYTLRSLKFKAGLAFSARVAGLLQTSKAASPPVFTAAFQVGPDQAGGKQVWRVKVTLSPQKQNTYWFDRHYPHILVRQQTWDGRSLELKAVKRAAYWGRELKDKN